jgi:CRP-like cAMP-binding protein
MSAAEMSSFLRKLDVRDRMSAEERDLIDALPNRTMLLQKNEELVRQGSRPRESCLVLEGYAARLHTLENGKQQISGIYVPGDFVDLHSLLLKVMDHSVIAFGPCRVAYVPHKSLHAITDRAPHLTRLLWLSTLIDAAILRTWVVSSGRRTSLQRFAHFLCELYTRLDVVGLVQNHTFHFPASQADVGDILGLSTVHVNRTLQELRATGCVAWTRDAITISDFDRLSRIGDFDSLYLNLFREPR